MRYMAVAGSFYPASPEGVKRQVVAYLNEARAKLPKQKTPPIAVVVPHAGYVYSGKTAAYSFASIEKTLAQKNTTVIFLGPNHTGVARAPVSISFDTWMTPVGKSESDVEVAGTLIKECKLIARDESAHLQEHSLEVQMPFLQLIAPSARVVCICLNMQNQEVTHLVAQAIVKVVREKRFSDRNFVLIASSDFTHYESPESARKKDEGAIKLIGAFDAPGFAGLVEKFGLSICGHGAIAVAVEYADAMGAKRAELLRYTNSGEEVKSLDGKVVAYASIAFIK